MGRTHVRHNGREEVTLVVFGEEETEPLLGAYALDGLGLAVDPLARRLVPAPGLLMSLTLEHTDLGHGRRAGVLSLAFGAYTSSGH